MDRQLSYTVIAIIAALGLVGVLAITILEAPTEAQAAGCTSGIAFNASKGRCFGH
jgi:hypothetical protein